MKKVKSSIQRWHPGKILILWIWGLVLVLVAFDIMKKVDNPNLGFALIAALFGTPAFLSVLTWHWLGGREDSGEDASLREELEESEES